MKPLLKLAGLLVILLTVACSGASSQNSSGEPAKAKEASDERIVVAENDEDTDEDKTDDEDRAETNKDEHERVAQADDEDRDEEETAIKEPVRTGDDFTITGGDVLQITVWKEEGLDREVLVLPDGTMTFPLIGSLDVQGLTPHMVQRTIKHKLKTLIPDASVTVMVKAPLGHTVSVLGQVTKPGEFVMSHRMGVMQALSEAGGLTPYASAGSIIVLRYISGKKTSVEFPYDDIAEGHHLEKDLDLVPGDVVFVPTAGLL